MKRKVLVIVFNNLKQDARVMRQISFLKGTYDVSVAAYDANPDPEITFVKLEKTRLTFMRKALSSVFLLLGIHSVAYRILYNYQRYIPSLNKGNFDLIVANDIETLPFAFAIANDHTRIFFDAHEYAPRQFEDRLYWRIFFRRFNVFLCNKYIPRVQGMSTINNSLAQAYTDAFGVKPIITTNAADFHSLPVIPREQLPIRLVHHGIFTISRQPDIMIEMMAQLDDRFTLDLIFMLPGVASEKTKEAFESFKQRVSKTKSITVHPALKPHEIIPNIHARYDIGVILVPPVNFNYHNGLPNKLFDCIQARLGMAVGPLKEIKYVTETYDIGVVSDDFTAEGLAKALRPLTLSDVNRFKQNADRAAGEMNADHNKVILLAALDKLFT